MDIMTSTCRQNNSFANNYDADTIQAEILLVTTAYSLIKTILCMMNHADFYIYMQGFTNAFTSGRPIASLSVFSLISPRHNLTDG